MATRVVRIALRVDRLGRLRHDPLETLLDVAALDQDRLAPRNTADLEPRFAKRGAQSQQIRRLIPRGRSTGRELSRKPTAQLTIDLGNQVLCGVPMAIDALDFDRRTDLAVEFGVPMSILIEVAIDTVHPAFGVDVHEVYRDAVSLLAMDFLKLIGRLHGCHKIRGRRSLELRAGVIEQIPLTVLLEDRAKYPAVAMKVGKLRMLEERIEFADAIEELWIPP